MKMMCNQIYSLKEEVNKLQVKVNENELNARRSEKFEWKVRAAFN